MRAGIYFILIAIGIFYCKKVHASKLIYKRKPLRLSEIIRFVKVSIPSDAKS